MHKKAADDAAARTRKSLAVSSIARMRLRQRFVGDARGVLREAAEVVPVVARSLNTLSQALASPYRASSPKAHPRWRVPMP